MKYKEYPVINYIYYSLVSGQQAIVMLRLWQSTQGNQATGNVLESALKQIGREDIVNKCMFNVEQVTDEMERLTAKEVLEDVSGFDAFKVNFQDIPHLVFEITSFLICNSILYKRLHFRRNWVPHAIPP